jgi:hypothetical protein
MALPVRVRCRKRNSRIMAMTAATMVSAWVDLRASPSSRPAQSRNSRKVKTKRSPSAKRRSSGPMMRRTTPLSTNMTPTEAMTMTTGFTRCLR